MKTVMSELAIVAGERGYLVQLTHNANDKTPKHGLDCDPQKKKSHRDLDQTDPCEVDRLRDKIQLHSHLEICGRYVLDVATSTVENLWNDNALASNALLL